MIVLIVSLILKPDYLETFYGAIGFYVVIGIFVAILQLREYTDDFYSQIGRLSIVGAFICDVGWLFSKITKDDGEAEY